MTHSYSMARFDKTTDEQHCQNQAEADDSPMLYQTEQAVQDLVVSINHFQLIFISIDWDELTKRIQLNIIIPAGW